MRVAADTATSRRDALAASIARRGFARVVDLAREVEVSEVTVRTDLAALEADGRIARVHGGAIPRTVESERESSLEKSRTRLARAKQAIAVEAAARVRPGQSVLLDVGSTTLAVAHALVARRDLDDIVVVTNGLAVALALESAIPRFTVVVTGGTLRSLQHSLVNPLATTLLDDLRADIAIIGATGVHAEHGVTNVNLPEAEVKQRMVAAAAHAAVNFGHRHGWSYLSIGAGPASVRSSESGQAAPTRCRVSRPPSRRARRSSMPGSPSLPCASGRV